MSGRTLRHLLAPFRPFLTDPATTEVVVNRPGEIGVEAGGTWSWHQEPGLTFDWLDSLGILAAFNTGQDIAPTHPLCGAALPDGERIQVCRPPATMPGSISITIRSPPSFRPTLQRLAEGGLFDKQQAECAPATAALAGLMDGDWARMLGQAVLDRKNILIAGATGSGKTTIAKALIEAIPLQERLVTIEDTAEWTGIPHRNRVALFYSKGDQGVARVRSEDLLECSLRMRPDRVLMQELRDGATFAYLRGVVAGHPGCITTLHAGSACGAFDALRLMIRQHPAGATLADADVQNLLRMLVDIVVYCERRGNEFRVADIYCDSQQGQGSGAQE
ncbi:MAG TPA: P-type DNA transfer ATPase VirB11 [Acetobacteraceae bacterium]|nr:P-type DNA transfer ATPase VirB11 [Acetobacteraceae bacterium]